MNKKKHLYNKINSEELKFALANEPFERVTASFYKYVDISVPNELRDELYEVWNQMGVFGRVYIADEGINAQVSICLLYTSPSPRDAHESRMPSSA